MNKQKELDKITLEIEICKACKEGKSGKAVPGEGNPNAKVVFIGEAPGKTEALIGRPFVGRSGKLLRSLIKNAGLREEDIYITSPVKYLPDRGTPSSSDIEHGKKHLSQQLKVIDPKVIVLLGNVATQGVLGEKIPILSHHGEIVEKDGRKYFITLHPAAALRFVKNKPTIFEDFHKLRTIMAQS